MLEDKKTRKSPFLEIKAFEQARQHANSNEELTKLILNNNSTIEGSNAPNMGIIYINFKLLFAIMQC